MVLEQWKGLSGSALKAIALVSMTVDHIAYYLMEHGTWTYDMMRTVGRMAFPIFAYLKYHGGCSITIIPTTYSSRFCWD